MHKEMCKNNQEKSKNQAESYISCAVLSTQSKNLRGHVTPRPLLLETLQFYSASMFCTFCPNRTLPSDAV